MKVLEIPLAELVEDMDYYPRHAVDDANVQSLALALEAGVNLPPIIADKKSKRIVDGWHRCRAYKRVRGPEAKVPVILQPYTDDAAMIEDAVRRNSQHGRRMDVIDQTRAVLMMEKFGASVDRIAMVLNVPETRVQKLKIRVARSPTATQHTVPGTKSVTLKASARHLAGKSLTKEQASAHSLMPGTSLILLVKQLRSAISSKLLNLEDDKLIAELKLLAVDIAGI